MNDGCWADEKENIVSLALIRTLCINLQQLSFNEQTDRLRRSRKKL